ncbi:hypothetical protein [Streptomyces poonensis]|uniref:Uncharacterized protein n=1 Tax=Streptomyces poonensis TaxID=68255 RepID=A0A918UHW5_9ACTN|nr:hypothetical protein [Streptomyces poonensis]GGZ11059.1 hypothetical protein GCM10010365_33150 [Streptomyces poonensis]GLJ91627.1 hypothetical protein GCM10017589_42340 [Streptomyces poonensis]
MTVCASTGAGLADPSGQGVPALPAAGYGDDPYAGHGDGGPYAGHGGHPCPRPGCVISSGGTYAARLAHAGGESWYPERWTLDGPEPYAVPLPAGQPEEPGTEVHPMGDGRVLVHRVASGRHMFSLLYPAGPGTGELPLGGVECSDPSAALWLLPPAPGGERAYALAAGPRSTAVWLVVGGAFGPEQLAEVPGHCSGGVWLDRTGRLLALDRLLDGRTKTVVVDLERAGEASPLLQIADHSDDRLLLADPYSGLLVIRSDAPSPGRARLGWGVLGSALPVRFPECLRLRDCAVLPFAIQPGEVLTPENCAVALRIDSAAGSWVGTWRPGEGRVHHLPPPEGWLTGSGLLTRDGVLGLPYATRAVPCGVSWVGVPAGAGAVAPGACAGGGTAPVQASPPLSVPASVPVPAVPEPVAPRPVPLQEAPLRGRVGLPAANKPTASAPSTASAAYVASAAAYAAPHMGGVGTRTEAR